jgi:hypothetical protein
MTDIHIQLDRIEKTVIQILETVKEERSPIETKWLTEPQVIKLLNVTKRKLAGIRKKNIIRCSSATGRNFLYYKTDVERYIYDHSPINKRNKG